MIRYVKGDIFSSPAQVLVNTVNTVGVMGKGVAHEYKSRYPLMFDVYHKACSDGTIQVGNLMLCRLYRKWILLFPTKVHWKNPSKIEYIESGLVKFAQIWDKMGIDSIAFPKLGCGNGKLDWDEVKPVMEEYLRDLPIPVYIYTGGNGRVESKQQSPPADYEEFMNKTLLFSRDLGLSEREAFKEKDEYGVLKGQKFWNYIRDNGIVITERIPDEYRSIQEQMLTRLLELNVIEPVFVSTDGFYREETNGYQYIGR